MVKLWKSLQFYRNNPYQVSNAIGFRTEACNFFRLSKFSVIFQNMPRLHRWTHHVGERNKQPDVMPDFLYIGNVKNVKAHCFNISRTRFLLKNCLNIWNFNWNIPEFTEWLEKSEFVNSRPPYSTYILVRRDKTDVNEYFVWAYYI